MKHKPPSLNNIIHNFTSLDELQQWALESDLMNHPLVQHQIRHLQSFNLTDTLNGFTDVDSLISWATDNFILNNSQFLDRLSFLLTCQWCNTKFNLSSELREHLEFHRIIGDVNTLSNQDELAIDFDIQDMDNFYNLNEFIDIQNVVNTNSPSTSYSNPQNTTRYNTANPDIEDINPNSQTPLQYGIIQNIALTMDDLEQKDSTNIIGMDVPSTSYSYTVNPNIENDNHVSQTLLQSGIDQNISLSMNDLEQKSGGNGNEELPYLFQMSGQKTFSKNLARETTYKVKFRDTWRNKKNA